jgi:hypothetical protein
VADVIIQRCTLRIVRRRGWSWGPRPQLLLKAAVAALPLLIARRLGDLLPDRGDTEITEPVSLSIPIKLSELLEFSSQDVGFDPTSSAVAFGVVDQRLTAAVARAFAKEQAASEAEPQATEVAKHDSDLEARQQQEAQRHHVLRVLLEWQRQGELDVHLASFSEQELGAWCDALLATVFELAVTSSARTPKSISRLLQSLKQRLQVVGADRITVLRSGLLALLELGAQLQRQGLNERDMQESLAQIAERFSLAWQAPPVGVLLEQVAEQALADMSQAAELSLLSESALSVPAPEVSVQRAIHTEFQVRSVLPFLLLGPLAKIGYFDALAATLEATGLSQQAHAFASALAFKVLSPPNRGWRREPEDLMAAAAFAGVESPAPSDELAELARKLSGRLTPLDSLLSYTLVKGHHPGRPLLLHRTHEENEAEGFLLLDVDGLFPICWVPDLQSLAPTLKYFSETPLLIQNSSVTSETLVELDAFGFRFVTDAPPTRAEPWRVIRRTPRERWYTNDNGGHDAALVRAAEELSGAAEAADLLWRALQRDRPAIPTARNSELERSLTLAVSVALGIISWTLWRDRETVTPVLALERFGSLGGKVRFTSSAVEVRLPLGRRRQDLYEHSLLADVENIPWMNGRRVEFLGG